MRKKPAPRAPPRVFVTATDTGVGKTEVACALLSLLADRGLSPVPFKPYESGVRNLERPPDALALRRAARSSLPLEQTCPHRFSEPLAPGVAAARAKLVPDWRVTKALAASFGDRPVVIEGAGGLFVPLDPEHDVIDLIETLDVPVILAARAGLGTLNHVGLSLEALERRGRTVLGVVLIKSQPGLDLSEEDNAALIEQRHAVRVIGPIAFVRHAAPRRALFKKALLPLLEVILRAR